MNLLFSNDKGCQYPDSYYHATATPLPAFETLHEDAHYDVCIVGGGYTGLSTALHLSGKGLEVVLLEAHRVGWGASGRNGGQVGSGFSTSQKDLENLVGIEAALALWDIAEDAKATVKQLISTYNIDCDWRDGVLATSWSATDNADFQGYRDHLLTHYNYDKLSLVSSAEVSGALGTEAYACGLLDSDAGHLHPLKFAVGLAKAAFDAGVIIHEGTVVQNMTYGQEITVHTERSSITASHVVLACNGYLGKLQPRIARRVMPINNFIVATEPLDNILPRILSSDVAVWDSKFVVNYFRRTADNRLLFGGGENYGYRFPTDIRKTVTQPMLEVFPQLEHAKLDYAWGGTLAITSNRMPHFEFVDHNVLSASGYSGHGVAMATMAGKVISEAISGDASRFELLASVPKATFPGGKWFRSPMLALAMTWYALRDRLP